VIHTMACCGEKQYFIAFLHLQSVYPNKISTADRKANRQYLQKDDGQKTNLFANSFSGRHPIAGSF